MLIANAIIFPLGNKKPTDEGGFGLSKENQKTKQGWLSIFQVSYSNDD